MELDLKLTQLGLKIKNLIVLDLSFPHMKFPEFKTVYESRFIHLPGRQRSGLQFAAGLASLGKLVLVYGSDSQNVDFLDNSLNVKLAKTDNDATYNELSERLLAFGPSVLLIPSEY